MPHARFASLILAAALAAVAVPVAAQDSGNYRDDYGSRDDGPDNVDTIPYAGADLAYDYVSGEYYRYEGPRQQDPRVREQTGYRDGTLQTAPNYGYYAGVTWTGRRYHRGCGCNAWYGYGHGRNYVYYDTSYEPYARSNGYYERYASSNSHRWGYSDRSYWGGWGY